MENSIKFWIVFTLIAMAALFIYAGYAYQSMKLSDSDIAFYSQMSEMNGKTKLGIK